ncbi:hypothetical protein Glove_109g80 [Diversispora epigaea]|uniref:Uncharacterized protein n=1 Tax=Diversispora epigaea TaxID=1348612 RepID=A0A397J2Z5_9GLOM|nr:hypothetical protein Glove_109g80 [Diversispora epigaea]
MDIQEVFIPKLQKYGVLHEAFLFVFISFAGRSFAELGNNVTKEEKLLAILGLQEIHARGVMHGDVRLENIMVKRDNLADKTLVLWIDFGWSRMGCNEKDLNKELIELKRLLGDLLLIYSSERHSPFLLHANPLATEISSLVSEQVSDIAYWISDIAYWISDIAYWVPNTVWCKSLWTKIIKIKSYTSHEFLTITGHALHFIKMYISDIVQFSLDIGY